MMRRRVARKPACSKTHRRAVVLIVVMVLVVMVALAGFGFLVAMSTEYEATVVEGDLFQARQVMASAETYVLATAEREARRTIEDGDPFAASQAATFADDGEQDLWRPQVVRPVRAVGADAGPNQSRDGRWRFSVVQGLPDDAKSAANNPFGLESSPDLDTPTSAALRFGLKDESSKLHLQIVLDRDTTEPGEGRRMLMELPGMTLEAADGILDWIDADDEQREFGAERQEYATRENSVGPRNGVPELPEELLFVKGVQRSTFYGSAFAVSGLDSEPTAWPELLTVRSAESQLSPDGSPRVNLNRLGAAAAGTADGSQGSSPFSATSFPSPLLSATAEADTPTASLPDDLLRFVQLGVVYGFVDVGDGVESTGSNQVTDVDVPDELSDPDFEPVGINSLAELIDVAVQVPEAAGGQDVVGPLRSADPDFAERFQELESLATIRSRDVLPGRVNIHLAPASVLQAVIGDSAVVGRIVQERQALDPADRITTVWLLSRQIVDLSTYRNIYPSITARGDVSTGEIVVYRVRGGPFLRRRITIDAARRPARRLDWTDLTEPGLPVPLSALRSAPADLTIEFGNP